MAKNSSVFVCTNCGNESPRWSGQCPSCEEWNTLEESKLYVEEKKASSSASVSVKKLKDIDVSKLVRTTSGFIELDRVLGGVADKAGFVEGEVVLVSGDPGIGKSTLLLQVLTDISNRGVRSVYVSAEESASQIALRAKRLLGNDFSSIELEVVSGNEVEGIIEKIRKLKAKYVVVDSVQTIYSSDARGLAGGVSQVKASSLKLVNFAKENDVTLIIVGHINKAGNVAGPKVLEHLVDAVLQIEGDEKSGYRLVRGLKNRYGTTNEVGILKMGESGLEDLGDAPLFFVSEEKAPGVCRGAIIEGNRSIVVEVQALTNMTSFSQPKRVAQGISNSKLQVICAVLQKHAGLKLYDKDVYVNIAGGLKVNDPGIDLAIAIAVASSLKGKALKADAAALGELSLTGIIGKPLREGQRRKELKNLGLDVIKSSKNIKTVVSSI
ncbi:DNA repair protein RadA [Candidatus Dojkabacteria bacterium]|nr:DNA repair protein RadA [Candidatus Dojkabacteria bacterium]